LVARRVTLRGLVFSGSGTKAQGTRVSQIDSSDQ